MESKKINQLATELAPDLSDLTIIGDPTTGISKKITLSQMASLFTGTVEEYANFAAFPLVGVADTIYVAKDTNVIYRWDSTAYVVLSPNIIASLVFNDANGFDGNISLVGSVATLTITTALTTGSVGFIGASGALLQDNANFFWDDTNNRLGLGTNAPTTALDVFGSGIIGRINGTSTNNAFLGFASAGTNKWSVGNVQSDHRFRIFSEANSAELISVLQTGEFGIGIANPTTKFHIDGAASALIANLDANVSVAKSVSFRSDNSNRFNIEVSGTESGSNAGADLFIRRYSDAGSLIDTPLTITRSTGNATFSGILITPQVKAATSAGLSINANSGTQVADFGAGGSANITFFGGLSGTSASFSSTATATAFIPSGATIPTNGMYLSAANTLNFATNTTNRVTINSVGSVGIGGTPQIFSTNIYFDVYGATTTQGGIIQTKTSNSSVIGSFYADSNGLNIRTETSNSILFTLGGTERMRILQSNGNVGIGTTNPLSKLSIGGDGYIDRALTAIASGGDFAATIQQNSTGAGLQVYANQSNWGNDSFKVQSNGGTQLVIKNTGNVGIGTASPSQILDVRKATASGDTQFNFLNSQNSSSGNTSVTSSIYLGFCDDGGGIANANKIVSGKTGDYTSAPTANSFLAFHTTSANTTAERMRIDAAGKVGIGVSPSYMLHVQGNLSSAQSLFYNTLNAGTDGNILLRLGSNCSNTNSTYISGGIFGVADKFYIYGNGNMVNVNNSYGTLSDIALKENIVDATQKLEDLLKLKVRNFNLIDDEQKTKQIGFIAQELEEVFPSMIDIDGKSGMKTIKTSVLVPMLVKAIQELSAEIAILKAKIK
jgi:hypothetical protein